MPYDCSVELSHLGYQFFTDIFVMFDKDRDGSLNSTELNDLFSTSPGNPWTAQKFPDTTVADETGSVTLQGWLAQWRCARSFGNACVAPQLITVKYDNVAGTQNHPRVPSIPRLPRRFRDKRFTGDETSQIRSEEGEVLAHCLPDFRMRCCRFRKDGIVEKLCGKTVLGHIPSNQEADQRCKLGRYRWI